VRLTVLLPLGACTAAEEVRDAVVVVMVVVVVEETVQVGVVCSQMG
jgi:hypothetical protein